MPIEQELRKRSSIAMRYDNRRRTMEQVIPTTVASDEPTWVSRAKSLRDFKIREEQAMRVLILAVSVLGILVSADVAKAGPSTTIRDLPVSVDQPPLTDEANRETEDQIGLDRAKVVHANSGSGDNSEDHPAHRRGGAHHRRGGGGGPVGLIGGMVGGLFGRR